MLLLLNHLSNWLVSEGLDVGELRAKEVEQFQRSRHEAGYSFLRSIRAMQPILGYLRGLGIAPAALSPPASGVLEAALARYRGYLILERGIRNASASRYIELMRPFLQTKVLPDGLALDLRSLTAADVISFVVTNCPRLSPGTAGLTVTALRSLLGFLYVDGAIDRSLVSAVPTVPGRRLTGLPKGLASDQVQRLLASCDTSTRSGCRDFAVLTMLVRLGLRAGEVAKLQLDAHRLASWRDRDCPQQRQSRRTIAIARGCRRSNRGLLASRPSRKHARPHGVCTDHSSASRSHHWRGNADCSPRWRTVRL